MNTKVINEVFNNLEQGKFDMAGNKISDNFSTTLMGKKLDKSQYLETYRLLLQGIPDLKLELKDVKQEGDNIKAKLVLSGTQSKMIPAMKNTWNEITPTGKKIDGLIYDLAITLKNDRIEEVRTVDTNKGMMVGLLNKLGLDYSKFQAN